MYSKQQASQIRQEFWTTFGKYMSPILSAEGEKVNWINYRTGEKYIQFKLETGNRSATVSIQITHPDADIRSLYFEQFQQLKKILEVAVGEEWTWVENTIENTGVELTKIYTEMIAVSVLNKEDWPKLISFFKPRIIALDEFWSNVKYGFEALR